MANEPPIYLSIVDQKPYDGVRFLAIYDQSDRPASTKTDLSTLIKFGYRCSSITPADTRISFESLDDLTFIQMFAKCFNFREYTNDHSMILEFFGIPENTKPIYENKNPLIIL